MDKEKMSSLEALQQSEARLKRAEFISKSGNWEYHLDSEIMHVSEGAAMLFGVKKDQFKDDIIKYVVLPQYRQMLDVALKSLIKDEAPYDLEFKIKTLDAGEIKNLHSIAEFDKEKRIVFGVIQDITERKQAEIALQKKETLLKETQRISKIGGWEYDVITGISTYTDEIFEIYGKTFSDPEEGIKFYHPDDRPLVWQSFEKAILGKPYDIEVRFINAKGKNLWVRTMGNPIVENGKTIRIIGNLINITKRKQAEEAQKASEASLNSLINNQNESIWSVDNNCNYIIFNDYFKKAYFATFNIELKKGMNVFSLLAPEWIDLWKPKYDKALSGEMVVFEFSNPVGNELHFYEVSLNPIIVDNKVTGVTGLSIDITEKKQAREVLLKSRANMSAIIENTTDSIWAINPSYEILYANAVFKSAFHASFGVLLEYGVNLLMALPEPMRPLWKSRYDRALNNERFEFVDKIDFETGSIYIEVFINPIVVDDKVGGVSFFGRNITERKQAEEELVQLNNKLKELNSTKDKLFSIIAHDLKAPFNSILGFSEILSKNIYDYPIEKSKEIITTINSSSKQTLTLLENLLAWANTQRGRINFKPEILSLQPIIQEIVNVLNSSARIKNININSSQLDNTITYADLDMLKTVLRNLIQNAIKFTDIGGKVDIYAISDQSQVEITIADNGVGMSEETLNKLFKIDEVITTYGTINEKGSGLGLILCKEFVEKHGGKIWAESEVKKGSKFVFTLPLNGSNGI